MHLIVTHEQTDFDALASLCAAGLLHEGTFPVLPRRLNRNVRAFLTLYGLEFNFVDPRDLPGGKVETVTLVDTQALVTLRGMGAGTSVRVIDHHPLRPDLPPDWQVTVEEIGATTTMLVEALQVQDGHLSPLQATLLLLGIYEDTGSLTYTRTTPRDARAAAWLLEREASLRIASDFLNPPLSDGQRKLYEKLLESAQTHHIHGHRIVIACGDARGMDEEVSTLAHKLRDLLDPDALFVLVTTDEGVRMVARSTSDAIDVSEVAGQFGGGGHDRAAAALVRKEPSSTDGAGLVAACARLQEVLNKLVRPSIVVAEIMSRRPQLLGVETTVKEAARLMQRTGFEGYPVVAEGKVVGLLTRRAVDRALAHKLNLTAANLMEAGSISVSPDDSLQSLQTVMTDTGWGQVPVVDGTGQVVGIVTRTDLLKTLAPEGKRSGRTDLVEKLEIALPAPRQELIRRVAEEAHARQMAVYIVGGFVRDLLLDRPSLDFDIVVEGDAIALGKALGKKFGGRVTSHARFGTAKWFVPDAGAERAWPEFLDLISARTEFYEHPTALPTVARGSIKLDLHRRDFTINTLALRLDGRHYGELHDYWGGLADLERGLVRVLHSLSFIDDPTRLLRAVRYEQRYAFSIEIRTRELMDQARALLEKLSGERVRHELDLILDEPNAAGMLSRLSELDLLRAIHPELTFVSGYLDDLDSPIPEAFSTTEPSGLAPSRRALGWLLWLSNFSEGAIKGFARRLRFPAALERACGIASQLRRQVPDMIDEPPSAWVRVLRDAPVPALHAVYLSGGHAVRQHLEKYMADWRGVKPHTTGSDLKARGLPPGPVYQELLGSLRAAWLDGRIGTRAQEEALLERLIEARQSSG